MFHLIHQLLIKDIRSIRLDLVLKELKNRPPLCNSDTICSPSKLIDLLSKSSVATLVEYVQSNDIQSTADLFNCLFQSIYRTYFWYDTYERLFMANICQVNDSIEYVVAKAPSTPPIAEYVVAKAPRTPPIAEYVVAKAPSTPPIAEHFVRL